jgi:hypothetical protein
MMMFESIIESILMYGGEIWRWKEQKEVEKVQEKYLRGSGLRNARLHKSARGID